jgi:putative SOS response-associated peptidase YedK
MAVQLTRTQIDEWLDPGSPAVSMQRMFVPRLAESLEIIPVSTHVNNARNKDERCLHPIAESQVVQ